MYFALRDVSTRGPAGLDRGVGLPFRRVALLLDGSEDAVGLVVYAVSAGGELPVALDLLLPTHIAGLSIAGSGPAVPERGGSVAARLTLAILLLFASFVSSSRDDGSENICAAISGGR